MDAPLESLPVVTKQMLWQVIDEGGRVRILLMRSTSSLDLDAAGRAVSAALEGVGVRGIPVQMQIVDAIPRTALGKAPLIRSEPPLAQVGDLR